MTVKPGGLNVKQDSSARLEDLQITGAFSLPIQVASADGALTVRSGIVHITKGSAAALTLAAPTASTTDSYVLFIRSNSAYAHTITVEGGIGGVGASANVGTFGAAAENGVTLYTYNGYWWIVPGSNVNVTFA